MANKSHAPSEGGMSASSNGHAIGVFAATGADKPSVRAEPGRNIALIRGTMLELVRRDGRDLTARQLTALLSVYLEPEIHSVSSVARLLNISRPGVTRILDRLVDADLVTRAEDPTDRRRVLIYRTRSGGQFVEDLIGVADQVAMQLGRLS